MRYNRLISDNDYNRASVFALSFLPTLTFNSNGRPLNIETGEENELWEHRKITRTFVREVTETYLLEYENGQSVETTSEHPFFIEGKGWVPVKNLRIGDYSRTRNGPLKLINITVRKHDDPIEVYNLEVEGRHNYIVTESGILVHNAGEYTHNKILTIRYESLPRNQYGARLFGTTTRTMIGNMKSKAILTARTE